MTRRTPRALLTVALLASLASGLAACGGSKATSAGAPSPAGSYPVTVGGVTLAAKPTHIVSLSPSATETLFKIGAGSQVTAVDDQSDYPANAPKSTLSGFKPNTEAIAAKNPDLVVIANDLNGIKDQLTKLKIPVYLAPAATTLDQAYAEMTELGTLTGHTAEARAEVENIKDGIASAIKSIPHRAKPLTYYYELDPTLYTVTSKTFIGSLFTLVGLTNIADAADATGSGYPQLSAEALVKANPDMIFLADTKCCQQSQDTVKARAGWSGVAAVQKGQVVLLDDDIASRWGPRVLDLVKAIVEAVAKVPAA